MIAVVVVEGSEPCYSDSSVEMVVEALGTSLVAVLIPGLRVEGHGRPRDPGGPDRRLGAI
jgi:hypothetical protein